MLSRAIAQSLMGIIPEKGPATVTLNAGLAAVPQTGTISASGSTITGVGTLFQSGPVPIVAGDVLVANSTSGTLNYISGATGVVTAGTSLTVVSVASDTSLAVSQTGLSFSSKSFFADQREVVQIYNAWEKPIQSSMRDYGHLNLQGDESLIKIPDHELNPANNGRQIRANDTILWQGSLYKVTFTGTTLKTVKTAWECVCQKQVA